MNTEAVFNFLSSEIYQAQVPEEAFGTVAIGVWLRVADAAGSQSELGASEALHEGVGPFLLLQQTPVSPFPQPHHQVHQSAAKTENIFISMQRMKTRQRQ